MSLQSFLNTVQQSVKQKNAETIINCFVLDNSSPDIQNLTEQIAPLLQSSSKKNIKSKVKEKLSHWRGWTDLVMAFFEYLITVRELDEYKEKTWMSLKHFYTCLATCFSSQDTAWMVQLVESASKFYVNISLALDRESEGPNKYVSDTSRDVFRMFNIVLSDRQTNFKGSKREAVFTVANLLNRLYFRMQQVRLCHTIQTNIISSGVTLSLGTTAERVTFEYYTGRCYLYQHQIHQAYRHLSTAFQQCPDEAHVQKRLCLLYLIVCQLILGRSPTKQLMMQFQLEPMFSPLIACLKVGNIKGFIDALEAPNRLRWFVKRNIYLTLRDRCEIVLWRNLFRKVFLTTFSPTQKTPHVASAALLAAARFATQDDTYDEEDVECICVSLIDQGYVKGYIIHSSGTLVLKRDESFGFEPIHAVQPVVMNNDAEDKFFGR
ncbi:nuclear pore associated protein Thp1-Sac3 complex subunit [Schizosaccharomyces japonicus yFS275]|uniref:Nuclear pore associated protein Thp1-Sac3 complex subunit n=1 Tax=Schizosaccharomyces japonicus (strain yFS275 / FY16936) TaxID=402676 RepID=B6JV91_SCHJY|nr:nuclear pore associated protein Thp1-Sac3 complex subunit [Schizosaccharomyces japonicus yFS275]EEB05292.1 nuclear pore associated protein Thp1-Sac3 complex subunit [Schizosaccharomyces japonicus yFS275]